MRHLFNLALLTGGALALSACGGGTPAANNTANEVVDNGSLAVPGNDASAMESVTNAPLPPPPAESNATNTAVPDTAPPPPSTPNVESNVAGM